MSNEVEIVVTGKDRSAKETLRGVGDEADKLDKKVGGASPGVAKLRREFDQTSVSVKKMKEEFARTGEESLWKGITDGEAKLRSLKKELTSLGTVGGSVGREVKRALADIGDEGGKAFGSTLQSSALQSIKGIATSPVGLAVGVGLAAAISPMIGAAVGAGVAVGFGGGILALGISRAVKDARVATAWTEMWADAGKSLDSRAGVFVQPMVRAAGLLGDSFQANAVPKIGAAFDTLKGRIDDLARGGAGMIANIFKGDNFGRVTDLADRLLSKLASELPNFGNAINDFLGSIADAGPGIEQFWGDFLVGSQRTVVAIGNVVQALSDTYVVMDDFGDHINDAFDSASEVVGDFVTSVYTSLDDFGNKANDAFDNLFDIDRGDDGPVRKLNKLKETTDSAADSAIRAGVSYSDMMKEIANSSADASTVYGAAVDKILSTTMGLDQASLGFAETQTRLSESIKENGLQLDIHTAKGQANREAILGVVSANQQEFDAMIRAGAGADQAKAAYESNTAALEHQMRQAGFTQGQIDNLIGKYRSVPADVDTNIEMHGLTEAIHGLDDTIRRVNGLDGRTANAYVNTYFNEYHRSVAVGAPGGTYGERATGGVIGAAAGGGPRNGWTWVGEQGRELVKLPPGSQVQPHGGSERMADAAAGGAGGGVLTLEWKGSGDPVIDAIVKGLSFKIRTDPATAEVFQVS